MFPGMFMLPVHPAFVLAPKTRAQFPLLSPLFWLPGCSTDITRRTTVPSPAVRETSINNGLWQLTGDSDIDSTTTRNSRVQSEENGAFRTLTVKTLDATGSDFVLRTNLKRR